MSCRRALAVVLTAGGLALTAVPAAARRVALLVGVSNYPHISQLEGPVNDVQSMRDVLVRRWGFAAADVRSLTESQATRAAILRELQALQTRSAPGDEVLIYFSGHGTSALDDAAGLPVPHGSGAFVPWDFKIAGARSADGLVVGRTDLRPLIEALDRHGRSLWVISDSCYSGQQVRSVNLADAAQLPQRMIPAPAGAGEREAQAADMRRAPAQRPADAYPYRATAYLAAAAEGERAVDVPARVLSRLPTLDGKPHGAMTDALLRVLEGQLPADLDGDGLLDLTEVHRAVADFMAGRAYGHTPQRLPSVLEDTHGLGSRAVLGARGQVAGGRREQQDVPLRVRAGGLAEPWQRALATAPGVQVVPAAPFDLQVQAGRGNTVETVTPAGDRIALLDSPPQLRAQALQLAWVKALRQLAERHRRGALPVEITPAEFGGNLRIGQHIQFVVRPDKPAWMVLLNINADARVSVLYPYQGNELQALAGGQGHRLPSGPSIEVKEPLGMDMQLVFAFDSPPEGLDKLLRLEDVDPGDPRLLVLQRALPSMAGRFTFAPAELRVLEPVR